MNRNGLGSKRAKSISSTQAGKRRVADVGPDRIIRHFGASDIKGWYDATNTQIAGTANDADLTFWYDKGPDQTHLYQGTAVNKPHYIHDGLNGHPVVRGDGSNDIYLTADAAGSAKNVDWSASCSAYVLVKTANDDNNHGIFGGDSGGTVPKSRFGCGSMQDQNPDELRIEVFGRVPDGDGEANVNMDNYYDMTGSTGMPTCRNQFALYYLEFQINAGQSGVSAFTRTAYDKNAVAAIPTQRTGETNASKVDASEATTMAGKGFDADQMQVFRNIHDSMDELDGDLGFLMFSNRHYSLKERQMISKAVQQIYGYADIN